MENAEFKIPNSQFPIPNSQFPILLLYLVIILAGWHGRSTAQPAAPAPPVIQGPPAILGPGQCAGCHAALKEDRLSSPTRWLAYDRHAKAGMGCVDCHGGDPKTGDQAKAHDPAAGFIGVPQPRQIPDLCARCHANPQFMITQNPGLPVDQYEKYWTSRHGQLLKMGLRKVAQCASCHTAHDIRTPKDPLSSIYPVNLPRTCAHCHSNANYMAGFPIPTDQYEKYAASVHGRMLLEKEDLGAPACNSCHGNHGAVPPGAKSMAHVCGICHALNAELFEKSPHAKAFALRELPQCTVCHQHHGIAEPSPRILNMEADSVCITCHRQDDAGWRGGKQMFALISGLTQLRDRAEAALNKAQDLGMDVSEGRFRLQDFRKDFLQLRTLVHALDLKNFAQKAAEAKGQAGAAAQVAESAIREYHFRRKGLLISLVLCFPVLILLGLKVRQIDTRKRPEPFNYPEEK